MTTINIEEDFITALEVTAKRKLTTVEAIVKEALQRYLQSETTQPKQEMTEEYEIIEPRTLTLSDRDRDLFLAALESPPPPNAALKALMSKEGR
jgi:plasmid stability protein